MTDPETTAQIEPAEQPDVPFDIDFAKLADQIRDYHAEHRMPDVMRILTERAIRRMHQELPALPDRDVARVLMATSVTLLDWIDRGGKTTGRGAANLIASIGQRLWHDAEPRTMELPANTAPNSATAEPEMPDHEEAT